MRNQTFKLVLLLIGLSLSFNSSSARAQYVEGAGESASPSYFRQALKKFKVPKTVALVGGQSAGGGHFIEAQIAQTLQDLVEGMRTKNPDNLDVRDFAELVEKTEIILTSDVSEFKTRPACELHGTNDQEEPLAKNSFPDKLLIKLYSPGWEKAYREGRDVAHLLYQEFRSFFFGNEQRFCSEQVRASQNRLEPIFENMKDGDYRIKAESNSSCLLHLRFNSVRKSVSLSWIDNSITGEKCASEASPIVFQCLANDLSDCVARRLVSGHLVLSMQDPSHGDFGWKSRTDGGKAANAQADDQQLLEMEGGAFVRVDAQAPQDEPKEFTVNGLFQDPRMNFSALCQKAYEKAQVEADRLCRLRYQRPANSCEVIRSAVRRNRDFDSVDRCRVEANVRLSAPEQSK